MGKPTAAESSQLNLMTNVAQKLRDSTADQATRDQALAMLLEVYVAERDLGLVSVTECERNRAEGKAALALVAGGGAWSWAKTWAVIVPTITICATLAGLAVKLLS